MPGLTRVWQASCNGIRTCCPLAGPSNCCSRCAIGLHAVHAMLPSHTITNPWLQGQVLQSDQAIDELMLQEDDFLVSVGMASCHPLPI